MRIIHLFCLALLLCAATAGAQLKITRTEKIPTDASRHWALPRFSPDGAKVYYTAEGFDGIWEYTIARRTIRQVTADPKSGYGFALSEDGRQIAYRRTTVNSRTRRKTDQVVVKSLVGPAAAVQASGPNLSSPVFSQSILVYSAGKVMKNLAKVGAMAPPVLLGIENTKIALLKNGKKVLLDPMGNGSYVWPSLAPDGSLLAGYEMDRGAFVCDVNGLVTARLGRCDAPSWTYDGNWLVYMEDRDDGHVTRSSDLFCITPDGKRKAQLTNTPDSMEMFPSCSPVSRQIVCSTANGELLLLDYEEAAQ